MQCGSFALLVVLLLSVLTYSHNTATAETEWKIYEVESDDEVIRIPYKITGGDVVTMLAEPYSNFIAVEISSFAKGVLQLKFLFEFVYLYEDEFLLLIDGEEAQYKELETTSEFMTIEIPFTQGSELIEIIGPTVILPSPSLEQLPIFVGTDRIIDGYSLTSDRDRNMKASWEATSFVMNSNGSFALRLKLHYLSDNPTIAKIYCGECPNEQKEINAENIRPVGSVVFLKIEVSFTTPGPMGRHGGSNALTDLIPLVATSLDDRTAQVYYEGMYNLPRPPSNIHRLDMLSMQISWLRIFEDIDGNRYYQWMRSWEHCNGQVCESQLVSLNELETSSGSFFVYYPKPEQATRPIEVLGKDGPPYYFDYVKWIKEQMLDRPMFEKIVIGGRVSYFQYPPSLLGDAEGSLHMIWSEQEYDQFATPPDYTGSIWYAKVNTDGRLIVAPKLMVKSPFITETSSTIHDNKIHVVWSDHRDVERIGGSIMGSPNVELYYMQLDKNGNIVVNATRVTNAKDLSESPSITTDNDGRVHVVWLDWRDSYSRVIGTRPNCTPLYEGACDIYESKLLKEIYYMKLDTNGNKIINDTRITFKDSFQSGRSESPKTAFDGVDQLHVVWADTRHSADIYSREEVEIYYTKLDLEGNVSIHEQRVTDAKGVSVGPEMAVDSKGNAHIFWMDDMLRPLDDFQEYDIYRTIISKNGTKIMNDTRITMLPEYLSAGSTNISIDENDVIHVIWRESWNLEDGIEAPEGHEPGIYYMRMNADGIVEQSPMFISKAQTYFDVVTMNSKIYLLSREYNLGISVTVVPEFPVNLMVITAAGLVGMLIASRLKGVTNYLCNKNSV